MTMPFDLPSTEYSVAVRINQDGDNQLRRVGMLSLGAVLAFDLRRVKLLKNPFIDIAVMISREQIE
jgi:hypothetical protein